MIALDRVRRALAARQPQEVHEPGTQPAAVSLILHPLNRGSELEALFIKRAARQGDPWSGQIALPGWRHEPADPDLLATAMRETREEVGIDLHSAELLGALDDLYPRSPTLPPVVVRPFVFAVPDRLPTSASDEVERAFWLACDSLDRPGVRREVKLQLRGVARVFPAYDLGEAVIWGMTERILTPFLDMVRNP